MMSKKGRKIPWSDEKVVEEELRRMNNE